MTNINPETGIRYGIIAANSLDPEVIYDLQAMGRDVHWEARKREIADQTRRDWENGEITGDDFEEELEYRLEHESDRFEDDEPVHEFQREGVRGQTAWLGGALLVFFYFSPHIYKGDLCSPCAPNAVSLDSLHEDGFEGYGPPSDWWDERGGD